MEIKLIYLCALAAFLELDRLYAGQFMLSRPVMAGSIIGFFGGEFGLGLWCGLWAEFLLIKNKPIGIKVSASGLIFAGSAVMLASLYNIPFYFAFICGGILSYIFSYLDILFRKQVSLLNDKAEREVKANACGIGKWIFNLIVLRFLFVFAFLILSIALFGFLANISNVNRYLTGYIERFLMLLTLFVTPVIGLVNCVLIFGKKNG